MKGKALLGIDQQEILLAFERILGEEDDRGGGTTPYTLWKFEVLDGRVWADRGEEHSSDVIVHVNWDDYLGEWGDHQVGVHAIVGAVLAHYTNAVCIDVLVTERDPGITFYEARPDRRCLTFDPPWTLAQAIDRYRLDEHPNIILISVDEQTGTPSLLDTWAACLRAGPDAESFLLWEDEFDTGSEAP
jgi:hypothetical protein